MTYIESLLDAIAPQRSPDAHLFQSEVKSWCAARGVVVVHGPPAMEMIYGGAAFLVIATLWNVQSHLAK